MIRSKTRRGPREMTPDEVRDRFLDHLRDMVDYWAQQEGTVHRRLGGLAFSILATIDGSSVDLPAFILAPLGRPEDTKFYKAEGENWWPENHRAKVRADIGGGLHDQFYRRPAGRQRTRKG